MQLQLVRVKILEEATAALLETAVNTFLAANSIRTFVGIQYQVSVRSSESAVIDAADVITRYEPSLANDNLEYRYTAFIHYTE